MKNTLIVAITLLATLSDIHPATAQQPSRVVGRAAQTSANDEGLLLARQAVSRPSRRLTIAHVGNLAVTNGDHSEQTLREIAVQSFAEQQTFADRLNRPALVTAGALAALPEIDDEVLEFEDAWVIRRSTTIIVNDPAAIARESELFRDYLDARADKTPVRSLRSPDETLDTEERSGLQTFMTDGVKTLHPNDPLRAAADRGEQALLDAIAAGQGQLVVEDTLIIPKVTGIDQGLNLRIPTIRRGVLDLKNPEPVTMLPLKGASLDPDPDPVPPQQLSFKAIPAVPAEPPARQGLKPKAEASGRQSITVEFLLGITRSANFQWERKWEFPSGFFRLTLGAGYAFGYRVPVIATAAIEPTRGYIQDYRDKRVVIGVAASVKTVNGNPDFYQRAGLAANQVHNGDELLLEANVGYGYKFRALWKDIRERPYTAIGVSYSQSFTPPMNKSGNGAEFAMMLDPKTTNISVEGTFVGGSATIRFDGRTWGNVGLDLQTLADNKQQKSIALKPGKETQAGVYPYQLTLDPVPLRAGTTTQTRQFGLRLANPAYSGRLVITPLIKLEFRAGYKKLKRSFTTSWIPLAKLAIDTGNVTLKRHQGTRSQYTWNEGEKTYRQIEQPRSGPSLSGKRVGQ